MNAVMLKNNFIQLYTGKTKISKDSIVPVDVNRILNDKIPKERYHIELGNYDMDYSPLMCYAIITNTKHTGLWLSVDNVNNEVWLPGGCVTPETYDQYKDTPQEIVTRAIAQGIARVIYHTGYEEEHQLLQTPINDLHDCIVAGGLDGPTIYEPILCDFPSSLKAINLYRMVTVIEPVNEHPPMSRQFNCGYTNLTFRMTYGSYKPNKMVWYSKKEHEMLEHATVSRATLLNSDYKYDIRVSDNGREIISKIFAREDIFGKSNVY